MIHIEQRQADLLTCLPRAFKEQRQRELGMTPVVQAGQDVLMRCAVERRGMFAQALLLMFELTGAFTLAQCLIRRMVGPRLSLGDVLPDLHDLGLQGHGFAPDLALQVGMLLQILKGFLKVAGRLVGFVERADQDAALLRWHLTLRLLQEGAQTRLRAGKVAMRLADQGPVRGRLQSQGMVAMRRRQLLELAQQRRSRLVVALVHERFHQIGYRHGHLERTGRSTCDLRGLLGELARQHQCLLESRGFAITARVSGAVQPEVGEVVEAGKTELVADLVVDATRHFERSLRCLASLGRVFKAGVGNAQAVQRPAFAQPRLAAPRRGERAQAAVERVRRHQQLRVNIGQGGQRVGQQDGVVLPLAQRHGFAGAAHAGLQIAQTRVVVGQRGQGLSSAVDVLGRAQAQGFIEQSGCIAIRASFSLQVSSGEAFVETVVVQCLRCQRWGRDGRLCHLSHLYSCHGL